MTICISILFQFYVVYLALCSRWFIKIWFYRFSQIFPNSSSISIILSINNSQLEHSWSHHFFKTSLTTLEILLFSSWKLTRALFYFFHELNKSLLSKEILKKRFFLYMFMEKLRQIISFLLNPRFLEIKKIEVILVFLEEKNNRHLIKIIDSRFKQFMLLKVAWQYPMWTMLFWIFLIMYASFLRRVKKILMLYEHAPELSLIFTFLPAENFLLEEIHL